MNQSLSARLAARVADTQAGPLIIPGVPDALTAVLAADVGFEAVYLTGAGVANRHLGVPDLGLLTLTELVAHADAIRDAVDLPIVVDADTGFGGPLNVRRTVRLLERHGANAVQIEDQVSPKRCGHFDGKEVVTPAEMVSKIHAAVDTRQEEAFLVIARTDAGELQGLDEAIERGQLYRDQGADVVFIEAPLSRDELATIGRVVPGPLLVNMVEGGKTPLLPASELHAMGFGLILYANTALRAAMKAMTTVLTELRDTGWTRGVLDDMVTWQRRQAIVGKPAYDQLMDRYAESDFTGDSAIDHRQV